MFYRTMAVSRVVSEISNEEKYRDLEMPVRGQSRSLKLVLFDRLHMVSHSRSIETLSLRRAVLEIFDFKCVVTLKTWFGVRQGH